MRPNTYFSQGLQTKLGKDIRKDYNMAWSYGLKTGFTSEAGYCLSASAERDGVEFIAVVMHCDTSDQRFTAAKTMLDHGFANYTLLSPQWESPLPPVSVRLGKTGTVTAVPAESSPILAEKSLAAAAEQTVTLAESVEAPVAQGQHLGTVTIRSGGQVLAEIPLVAAEAVDRLTWKDAALRVLQYACFG